MEITTDNFDDEFNNITHNLKRSCFVGFDAEFTAILSGESFKHRLFDTCEDRYNNIKDVVSQMVMTQVGLTMFHYERDQDTYVATGYTFHLCPQVFGNIDQSFTFQASTLRFLCRHNFDFNKFTYKGIPYLSQAEEASVREQLQHNNLSNNLPESFEMADEKILKEYCSEVSKWLHQSTEGTMYLDVEHPVMRFVVHTEVRMRFPNVLTTDSLGNSKKILIYRDENIEGANSASKSTLEENLMNYLLGFSRIIKLLEEYKKPIVGHNIFLDTILLHSQFIGPMPKKYSDFKRNVNKIFPIVFDTKYISHEMGKKLSLEEVWKSNALQDLYEFFLERKCLKLHCAASQIIVSTPFNAHQSYHEAGWDSYCSAYCFARLGHWMACENNGAFRSVSPTELLGALSPFVNKINVIRGAVPFMNLVAEDPPRHRPGLLHVRAVRERAINLGRITSLLAAYGSVDVKPYDTRSALVAVNSKFTVERILKSYRDHKEYRFSKYNVYRHSALARASMWSGALLTGSLVLYMMHRKLNQW